MCPNCLLRLALPGAAAPGGGPTLPDGTTQREPASPARAEAPGARIGRYKLLEPIGEGGFGTVWRAEQTEPVRRRVALKIIKLGMDTREVVARFEAERQALALMDHPNIARVFDGGATENGRPYFVMELVKGVRLTEFCDARRLSMADRLRLFIEVCQAVQHAHQKGVIHRDLKPTNVLVTEVDGRPVPKVIDFGIAKATGAQLTDKTLFTRLNQVIGTPAYMSPEQAGLGSLDIDTRSDVYSLGVLLYELLTGRTPFSSRELIEGGWEAMLQVIRDREPPRPSTRLSTLRDQELVEIARQRQAEPRQLSRLIRRDLDWVVMKCLEKDRSRRYDSAAALARDLERFLNHEPVSAVAPSAAYQFSRFARRHRVALATGAAFAVVLLVATVVSTWQAMRATRLAGQEQIQRRKAEVAETAATGLRQVAETNVFLARRNLYAAEVKLVVQALAVNNLERARSLLRGLVPEPGQPDLREWEWRWLATQCLDQSTRHFNHPREAIRHLVFRGEDRRLVSLDGDGKATVFRWPDGSFQGRVGNRLNTVGVSAGGRWIASARSAGIEIFEWPPTNRAVSIPAASLTPEAREGTNSLTVQHLRFSPDDRWLACSGSQLESTRFRVHASVWDWREGRLAFRLVLTNQQHFQNGALAFSPDSRCLAMGGSPGWIQVVSLPGGTVERVLQLHDEQVTALAFSPDGRWLAAGSGMRDNLVRLFDRMNGYAQHVLRGHVSHVPTLLFSPDSRWLVSGGNDQTVRLWDMRALALVRTLRGHGGEISALAWAPDGASLVSGSRDGALKVWALGTDTATPGIVQLPFLNLTRFDQDLRRFAGMTDEGRVMTGEVRPDPALDAVPSLGTGHEPVHCRLDLSPDGDRIVLADARGGLRLWDRQSGLTLTNAAAHDRPAVQLAFLPRPGGIAAYYGDQRVKIFSSNLVELHSWRVRDEIRRASHNLAPELGVFVGRGRDTLEFFDLQDGRFLGGMRERGGDLTGLAVSADGRTLALSDDTGSVEFWDTKTWHVRDRFRGHVQGVRSVAYSPDGRRLAVGGIGQESVKLWDPDLGQELCTLPVDAEVCHALKFSRDGRNLAVALGRAGFQVLQAPDLEALPVQRLQPGPTELGPAERVLFDDFEGRLALPWQIRHEAREHYSLTRAPGSLSISTQPGGFVQQHKHYTNLFTVRTPFTNYNSFAATVRIQDFRPDQEQQQAGLVLMNDEDNYVQFAITTPVKRTREPIVLLIHLEKEGRLTWQQHSLTNDPAAVWLRIQKTAHVCAFQVSSDGEHWRQVDAMAWEHYGPEWFGLVALNGPGSKARSIPARFDYFEVRRLAPLKQ